MMFSVIRRSISSLRSCVPARRPAASSISFCSLARHSLYSAIWFFSLFSSSISAAVLALMISCAVSFCASLSINISICLPPGVLGLFVPAQTFYHFSQCITTTTLPHCFCADCIAWHSARKLFSTIHQVFTLYSYLIHNLLIYSFLDERRTLALRRRLQVQTRWFFHNSPGAERRLGTPHFRHFDPLPLKQTIRQKKRQETHSGQENPPIRCAPG